MTRHGTSWESVELLHATLPDIGLDGDDRHLLALLSTHREREAAALDGYRYLIEHHDDEGVRYLGHMLLEDEERHHRLIDEMVNSVRSFIEELPIEPHTPEITHRVSDELETETKALIELEKDDLAELKQLKKNLKGITSYPMFGLLVDMMIHDTSKHIEMLRFILDRSKS